MNPDGLNRLRIAVVRRTAQDYIEALRMLRRHSGATGKRKYYCTHAEYVILDCERFFRYDCDSFVDLDGIALMESIRNKSYDPHFWIKGEE